MPFATLHTRRGALITRSASFLATAILLVSVGPCGHQHPTDQSRIPLPQNYCPLRLASPQLDSHLNARARFHERIAKCKAAKLHSGREHTDALKSQDREWIGRYSRQGASSRAWWRQRRRQDTRVKQPLVNAAAEASDDEPRPVLAVQVDNQPRRLSGYVQCCIQGANDLVCMSCGPQA